MRFLCFGNIKQIEREMDFFKWLQMQFSGWSYGLEEEDKLRLELLVSEARLIVRDLQWLHSMLSALPFLDRKKTELEAWRELRMVFNKRIPAVKASAKALRGGILKHQENLQ